MEKKRKLPARAAARSEQAAKKRNLTPRHRSETPAASSTPQPVEDPEPPPPPPLPKSIDAGKPLPTIEDAQPEDLTSDEFQSVSESGVLAESLSRSRHKWISDGLFEKFWTKPHKRKGVLIEDPKNPAKDSMNKIGTVTICIEPHVFDAVMYTVKDPKPRQLPQSQPIRPPTTNPQQQQPAARPILQYGPPNGSMPPPPTPNSAAATPSTPNAVPSMPCVPSPVSKPAQPSSPAQAVPSVPASPVPRSAAQPQTAPSPASAPKDGHPDPSQTQKVPLAPSAAPSSATGVPILTGTGTAPPRSSIQHSPAQTPAVTSTTGQDPVVNRNPTQTAPSPSKTPVKPPSSAPGSAPATPAKPPPNDPVIAMLAQKASSDANLRNLMKRVAVGQAKEGELAQFQKIIDQLNAEYKQKTSQQVLTAERLLVDGRSVKYFAGEVKTILEIVLATNPNQRSSELRPPPRSDPLVVLLVKTALEDQRTKDIIKRIAEGRPSATDPVDLKEILERLRRDAKTTPQTPTATTPIKQPIVQGSVPNGHVRPPISQTLGHPNPQALRSKGPPPTPRPDISAVVFDFGTGDRYLFPKFTILEYLPTQSGQQVVASFLIVRKGSTSEYGGDPKLDYYQPVTIRLYTQTGRSLENLARAVAPQDEVRRYMDDVMDNMTRAEYVLLAMRLPREVADDKKDNAAQDESKQNGVVSQPDSEMGPAPKSKAPVLWNSAFTTPRDSFDSVQSSRLRDAEHETEATYQRLINSVTAKNMETV